MQQFSHFYRQTYLKRSGHNGYLNTAFFELLQQSMADKLVLMFAKYQGEVIAATLSFKDKNCLYGRYWGTNYELDSLHFELCYYQGIEYCIANKLKQFHSGAQGEHKISRGFKPVYTYSLHHIQHGDFAAAINDFIRRERQHMALYKSPMRKAYCRLNSNNWLFAGICTSSTKVKPACSASWQIAQNHELHY